MATDQDFFVRLEDLIKNANNDPSLKSAADIIARWGCASASIAILDNGKITTHSISSVGDDTDTLFQACSISKPVAGTAMMRLIEEGLLSLDDNICDLLPENITQHLLRDPTTAPTVKTIKLKHLLSHTAGISQGGFPGYPDKENYPSPSDIITGGPLVNTLPVRLITLPGLEFMYAGGGCVLFQIIMEQVTKKPFDQIVTEYILKPLNMTRSCYKLSPEEKNISKCYYNGHLEYETDWHVLPEQAAAGLWTTPTDLLKLINAIQKSLPDSKNIDENRSTKPLLQSATAQTMLTLIKQAMCLTWFATDTQFGHSGGNMPSYRCYAFGYHPLPWNTSRVENPKHILDAGPKECGIAIMTNSMPAIEVINILLHAITFLKGWPQYNEFKGVLPVGTPIGAPSNTPIDETWKEWLGVKWSDTWTLIDDKGSPAVRIEGSDVVHPLKAAAMPRREYEGGKKSVDLVFDRLKLMVRLDWDGEERVVEFWNGGREERVVMRRPKVTQEVERSEGIVQ